MMSLALTASAKDGLPIASTRPTSNGPQPAPATPGQQPASLAQETSTADSSLATRKKASGAVRRWLQTGMASWYGPRFQGRPTAGGERFNMYGMTCAHRTLPLGPWLRVTNLKNHKTIFVRVNDRGPVLEGRIVDLSYAAAQTLGLVGLGRVKLEEIRQSDPELPPSFMAQLQMPDSLVALGQ